MAYKCEEILIKKYGELKELLKIQGIETEIHMIRNYMIKIILSKSDENLGRLVIYYSPKKDSYSFKKDNDMVAQVFEYIVSLIDGNNDLDLMDILSSRDDEDKNIYKIYVDGSYMNGKVGYGAIILKSDTPVKEIYGVVTDDYATQSRQVGGEIVAVQEGLKWCENEGIKDASIYYDFQNLEKWATGEYKTNNTLSQSYKSFIDNCKINIKWYKVKSHTGVKWNDKADELAKLGITMITNKKNDEEEISTLINKGLKKEIEGNIDNILKILSEKGFNVLFDEDYHKNSGKIEINWNK